MIICEHAQALKVLVPLVADFVTLGSLERLPLASVNTHWVHTKRRNCHASTHLGRGLLTSFIFSEECWSRM